MLIKPSEIFTAISLVSMMVMIYGFFAQAAVPLGYSAWAIIMATALFLAVVFGKLEV